MYRFAIARIFHLIGMWAVIFCVSTPTYAQQNPPTAAVGMIAAERKAIAKSGVLVGRVEAVQRVEVRARVTGYLEGVLFKEGDLIKEGAPLYRIEKGLFEAAVDAAEAAVERSKAAKLLTEVQLRRAQELLEKSSGTVVARDQAVAADEQAKGQLMGDEANLTTAKINLGYTDIVSPITGKIGKTNITKGNVVDPNSGMLTVIVSQDPMYVSFPISQRDYLAARERNQNVERIKARVRFSDGTTYGEVGEINFVDVSVNRSTDTILVRAKFPNAKSVLIDGQLVQVIIDSGDARRKSPSAASRTHCRPGRHLCFCGRGWQGRRQAPQDRSRGRDGCHRGSGPQRRRADYRARCSGRPCRDAGAGHSPTEDEPELTACYPRCSLTARALQLSLQLSRQSRAYWHS